MSVTAEQLAHVCTLLQRTGPAENPLPALRAALPGMVFTRCDASDMDGETPATRAGDYDLYLVDNSDHCWRITTDPQHAGGVVIAAHR
ncbi:hypothetical protein SAMN05421829_11656 [Aromatoleum tolulyticum]|uniref:Uncharacterized protein n=1 Tax=Aromatoleum tolulyticum TaxID=34027 RepID=A0A1N7B5C2_9RHOO|nr:hypothetical protein [Aromatoleum tolulyticum]SIR46427.1 hypothetical protein SAMN05421829_11656 [Aromatoleum tolulyticum]